MSLTDHARAARIEGEAIAIEAGRVETDQTVRMVLVHLAKAKMCAADLMEADDRNAAIRWAAEAACTIDHGKMATPRCPACGAPRG